MQESDKELLELAAKAAGYKYKIVEHDGLWIIGGQTYWNPLQDDGDALRLAVKLEIDLQHFNNAIDAIHNGRLVITQHYNDDCYAATRRAIVKAAAEIGRNIE